jgi:hypothetical protein
VAVIGCLEHEIAAEGTVLVPESAEAGA